MRNAKTLNYAGVLRAFNKVEEASGIVDKTEILSALSNLIDRVIQEDLEQVRYQNRTVSNKITVADAEIKKLLTKLEESDIVLYESISNEQALIVKKHYRVTSASGMRLKGSVYSQKNKKQCKRSVSS